MTLVQEDQHRDRAADLLRSPEALDLFARLQAFAENTLSESEDSTLEIVVERLTLTRLRKVGKLARKAHRQREMRDREQCLHALRRQVKKLRYGLEMTAPLFGDLTASWSASTLALQRELGPAPGRLRRA